MLTLVASPVFSCSKALHCATLLFFGVGRAHAGTEISSIHVQGFDVEAGDGADPPRAFLGRLRGPKGAVYALAFSQRGDLLAAGSKDRPGVHVWNLTHAGLTPGPGPGSGWRPSPQRLMGHTAGVTAAAFAGTDHGDDESLGILITGAADNTTRIWDYRTGELKKQLVHPRTVFGIAVRPKDKGSNASELREFATACWDGVLRLFSWPAGEPKVALEGHSGGLYSVAYSPLDGALLATASADKTVKIWDTRTYQVLWTLRGHRDHVTSVDWSPRDKFLLASGSWDRRFRLWEVAEEESAEACRGSRLNPGMSGEGKCPGGPTQPRAMGKHPQLVFGVKFSPGGDRVAACHGAVGQNPTVVIYDATTGKVVRRLGRHKDTPLAVAWSSDGTMLASAGMDRTVLIYEADADIDDMSKGDEDDQEEKEAWLKDLAEYKNKPWKNTGVSKSLDKQNSTGNGTNSLVVESNATVRWPLAEGPGFEYQPGDY